MTTNNLDPVAHMRQSVMTACKALAVQVATAKFDLSEEHYKRCLQVVREGSNPGRLLRYAYNLSQARIANRAEMAAYDYTIVSLGQNCLPRTVLTRWGLKPTRAQGEKSMPLDLAVHIATSVPGLLKSRFEGYFDNAEYREHLGIWLNPKKKVRWNHDRDMGPDDLDKLKVRYTDRIENLYACISSNRPILFVHCVVKDHAVEETSVCLKSLMNGRKYEFLIVDHSSAISNPPEGAHLVTAPYPKDNYVWHKINDYSSAEGVDFELKMARAAASIIKERFPKK